jgi:hypothetical protein
MDFALKAVELALSRGVAVVINKDGQVVMGGAGMTGTGKDADPQYTSDTIQNLPRGAVAKQVRTNFKKLGTTGIVIAHYADTVRQAFNNEGWGVSLQTTENPYEFFWTRTRITRRARSI